FNGVNAYIQGPTGNFPTGSNAISMFAWIKTTSTSRETIVSYGSSATGQTASINVNQLAANGHFVVDFYNDYVDSGIVVNDGNWHFVGFSLPASSTSITMVVDGKLVSATLPSIPNIASGTNYQIGRWVTAGTGDTNPYWFNGAIANVQIYNTSLTSSQIQQLYYAGIPPSNELRIVLK
ncbi:MAG: LamG domain-containing protein, partial [Candidatus Micrarchaeales archaeon]